MHYRFLVFFVLFCFSLSAGAPTVDFTKHSELGSLMELDFGDSLNLFVNDFGEPELFFDSVYQEGLIEVVPLVGEQALVKSASIYKLSGGEISGGIDGEPAFEVSESGNAVALKYNPLVKECGGNYVLFFQALNPVDPNDVKDVKLRIHIECKADLIILFSPLMGEPTQGFVKELLSYIDTLASEGTTARIAVLPQSVFDVKRKLLDRINKTIVVTHASSVPIDSIKHLSISISHFFHEYPKNVLAYFPNLRVSRFPFNIADSQQTALHTNPDKPWQYSDFFVYLTLRTREVTHKNLQWFKLRFSSDSSDRLFEKFFFPDLCSEGAAGDSIDINGVSVVDLWSGGYFTEEDPDCEDFAGLIGELNKSESLELRPYSITLLGRGSVEVVNSATLGIDGIIYEKDPDVAEIPRNVKAQIKKLLAKHRPKYFLLVGSVDHIPMSFIPTSGRFSQDKKVPSDALYTFNPVSRRVEVEVARIPIALNEGRPWDFAAMVLRNSLDARSRKISEIRLIADQCGTKDNCFFWESTRKAALDYWRACVGNPNCISSPPYCYSQEAGCSGIERIKTAIASADFVQVNEHGSGASFTAEDITGQSRKVFQGGDIPRSNEPGLTVQVTSCYGGSIDTDYTMAQLTKQNSTVFNFLQSGTGLLIANTRFGGISTSLPLQEYNHLVLKAVREKDGRRVADLMNERRNNLIRSNEFQMFIALQGQIYGDPTLQVYRG